MPKSGLLRTEGIGSATASVTRSVKTGTVQSTPLLLVQSAKERCDAAFPYRSLLCKFRIKDAGVRALPWLPRELFISLVCIELPELFLFPMRFCPRDFCLLPWVMDVWSLPSPRKWFKTANLTLSVFSKII